MIEHDTNSDRCPKCGAVLFCALPVKTTVQEIVRFASPASAFKDSRIAREGWIHPAGILLKHVAG